MASVLHYETTAGLYARLYSFYRHAFPAEYARSLPQFMIAGFEKRFGVGVLGCTHCSYTTDCRLHPEAVDASHYAESPDCRLLVLDDSPLNAILEKLQAEINVNFSGCQYVFEDDLLRCCSVDADFRELTFAYGQWSRKTNLPVALLARHGFYFSPKRHLARCVSCLLQLGAPSQIQDLPEWHKSSSPNCTYVGKAATNSWDLLQFEHELTGHFKQELDDIEILEDDAPSSSAGAYPAQPAVQAGDVVLRSLAPLSRDPPQPRPTPTPSRSLGQLFNTLNTCGLYDAELRHAILADPALIECRTTPEFLQRLAIPIKLPRQTSQESETTLRAGNMAVITDAKCDLCLSNPKNAAFLPCGHVYGCLACSNRVKNGPTDLARRCCVCRVPVQNVLPLLLTYDVTEY